jgi:hypothetical protein
MSHGDASPQNLLVPADAPDTFVAIDLGFQTPHAVGFDLGQLLVGLVHAGEMPAAGLSDVDAVLVPAFVEGLRTYGVDVSPSDVAYGYYGSLALRAGFTSLPIELLSAPAEGGLPDGELMATFRERAALTRFIVDRGLSLS